MASEFEPSDAFLGSPIAPSPKPHDPAPVVSTKRDWRAKDADAYAVAFAANIASLPDRGASVEDMVTLPKHYARYPIEPVRFCVENNLNAFQFNIIKYILRHDAKNGMEDLKKAKRYLEMFMKFMEKDPDWWKG